MSHIKSSFSIKDLENLSGVKAHTIRIWEKRYNLLNPERTDTNIRFYTLESLRKLLNISLLNSEGFKISKIADLDNETFHNLLQQIIDKKTNKNQFVNQLKIAMLNFDAFLFEHAYNEIEKVLGFSEIFKNYLIPFLNEIGLLWQSGTVNLTHEHFISNLIKQKILINVYKLQVNEIEKHDKVFILFLPDNEIHDLGLTYLQYEVLNSGYKSIMLGASVPIDSLIPFINEGQEIIFISYFTVQPDLEKIPKYIETFNNKVLLNNKAQLNILGKQISLLNDNLNIPEQVKLFKSIDEIIIDINV